LFISRRYNTVSGFSLLKFAAELGFLSRSSFFIRIIDDVSVSSGVRLSMSFRSYILQLERVKGEVPVDI
jgi:hypothetical protein